MKNEHEKEDQQFDSSEKKRDSDSPWKQFPSTEEEARKFIQKLREMPYDTSKVGQVFITTSYRQKIKSDESKESDG